MEKVIIRTLSHPFEGELLKDMLKNIGIDSWVSDANGPQKMENYFGDKAGETYLFVLKKDLEAAEEYLSAEIQVPETLEMELPMKFPYWIIPAFTLMLLFFVVIQRCGS